MLHGAGIFTYIYPIIEPHVGKYTIHGAYGHMIIYGFWIVCNGKPY